MDVFIFSKIQIEDTIATLRVSEGEAAHNLAICIDQLKHPDYPAMLPR